MKDRSEYQRAYYRANRRRVVLRMRRYAARKAKIVRAAKDKPCKDCRRRYMYYVMDFDHVRGRKMLTIAHLKGSIERLLIEIAKCDVVCANCHRKRTWRRQWRKQCRNRTGYNFAAMEKFK